MRQLHDKDNSQQKRPSPWAAFAEEQEASARAYDDLCYETGLLFQDAQHEAYEQWVAWDEAIQSETVEEMLQPLISAPVRETAHPQVVESKPFQRSSLTLLLLYLLHEGEMHGYRIYQIIEQRSRGRYELKEGTIYPLLYELEQNGMIEGQWRKSLQEPARKYFRLTSKGRELLEREKKTCTEFVELGFSPG